jgi:signal recognition particle subunit SRP68
MDITSFITSQRESALLVGDYSSYRKRLTRRLLTLRKKLGKATPKNAKYAPKSPVTAQEIGSNVESLHMLLIISERAWAQAMAMKNAHSEDNTEKTITGSTRSHIISKLHKAAVQAKEIVTRLSEPDSGATDIDLLEAQAYTYSLLGAEEFEKQSEGVKASGAPTDRWIACLTNFSAARVIYNALLTTTKQDMFKDMLAGTVDPSIRFAAYQHKIPRTVAVASVAKKYFPGSDRKLLEAVQKIDAGALQQDGSAATAQSSEAEEVPDTIAWRSRTANIVDAAIGQALSAVNSASGTLHAFLKTHAASSSSREKGAAYDDVLIASQDAVDATKRAIDELEKEGVDEGDARMQDLRITNLAVNYDLISWRVGRNRVLIGVDDGISFAPLPPLKPRQPRKDGKEWVEREEPNGRKLARLRERVALYDAILQSIDSIKELRGAVRDGDFIAELEGQRAYFQALKCLNISHSHALLSAPRQALALCNRALGLSAQAVSAPRPPAATAGAPKLIVSVDQAKALNQHLENFTSHYRGVVALSQHLTNSDIAAKAHLTTAAPIVERLNEYPTSGKVDLQNLVTWPPKLRPVPVKPLFLDVAWNYIEYPGQGAREETEPERVEADEKTGEAPKPNKGWFGFGR